MSIYICVCTYMYIHSLYICIGHIRYVNVNKTIVTRGVSSHRDLAIYNKKYLKAKEEVLQIQTFSSCKNIIVRKKSSKRTQNPSRHHNSLTNLKFLSTQAKISSFKNPHINNRPIIITT
jgi:hypothetical protein